MKISKNIKKSKKEILILDRILSNNIPPPIPEYKFLTDRKFRFDFAWPEKKVAVEFEGGIWINGAHTRGNHFNSDCEKYNLAVLNGWRVLRYTTNMLDNIIPDLKSIL